MLISKIKIENYRGLAAVEVDLDSTTVLIGANNVGKSSVLSALDAVLGRQAGRGSRISDYDHFRADTSRDLPDGHQVRITLTFSETSDTPWGVGPSQALNDAIQLDGNGDRSIVIQMRHTYSAKSRDFSSETRFLNVVGEDLPNRTLDRALRRFVPAFYLEAERSAGTDFRSGARFWSAFLKDPAIDDEQRRALESQLARLSSEITEAAPALASLRQVLEGAGRMIDLDDGNPVSLEPLPTRLLETLRRTEVRLTSPGGASIPLALHGGGAQNVAVLFLFQAYMAAAISQDYDDETSPVLAIEEPEAHLHPSATRATWRIIENLKGQRVIATHSGDLLSLAPLSTVRRLVRESGEIRVHRVAPDTLTAEEARKVDFHVRKARGELLFGEVWLIVEGESEHWLFGGAADGLDLDIERSGVRIVDCLSHAGARPLIKVADDLGIAWHCAVDGDMQGQNTATTVRKLLSGRKEKDHLTVIDYTCVEHLLCEEGFGDVYEAALTKAELDEIRPSGDPHHWKELAEKIGRRKVPIAVEVATLMKEKHRTTPPSLEAILRSALNLSRRS